MESKWTNGSIVRVKGQTELANGQQLTYAVMYLWSDFIDRKLSSQPPAALEVIHTAMLEWEWVARVSWEHSHSLTYVELK